MKLQRAQQIAPGLRILSNGDLQISLSNQAYAELVDRLWGNNPDVVLELTDSIAPISPDLLHLLATVATDYQRNNYHTDKWSLGQIEQEYLFDLFDNSDFGMLSPSDIDALTDAPIIGYDFNFDDQGNVELFPTSKVWWYPNYAIKSFIEDLLENGETIFTKAEEN